VVFKIGQPKRKANVSGTYLIRRARADTGCRQWVGQTGLVSYQKKSWSAPQKSVDIGESVLSGQLTWVKGIEPG
jgi:hypothetical protein